MYVILAVPYFALWNLVRGGWPYIVDQMGRKPWWKKSDILWLTAHLPLIWFIGWPSIFAAIGAYIGALSGWGTYIGAVLDGKYEDGKPHQEIGWIDFLIRPFESEPVLYGLWGLFFRGLLWFFCVFAFLAPSLWFFKKDFLILIGCVGYACMPFAFYAARFFNPSIAWKAGEVIHGALIGFFWMIVFLNI